MDLTNPEIQKALEAVLSSRKLGNRWVDLGNGKIGITYYVSGRSLVPLKRDGQEDSWYRTLPFGSVVVHEVDPKTGETMEGPNERMKKWSAVEHVLQLHQLKWLPEERWPDSRRRGQ